MWDVHRKRYPFPTNYRAHPYAQKPSKKTAEAAEKAALRLANKEFDDTCGLFVGREWTCTCLDFQHRGPKICKHIRKRAKQLVNDKLSPSVGAWIEPSETDDSQYEVSVKLKDTTPSA